MIREKLKTCGNPIKFTQDNFTYEKKVDMKYSGYEFM